MPLGARAIRAVCGRMAAPEVSRAPLASSRRVQAGCFRLKALLVHRFDHRAKWPAKVRNVSRLGSQTRNALFHSGLGRAKELNRLYSGSNPRCPLWRSAETPRGLGFKLNCPSSPETDRILPSLRKPNSRVGRIPPAARGIGKRWATNSPCLLPTESRSYCLMSATRPPGVSRS